MIDVYFSNVNKKPNSDTKPVSETLIKCAYKNPTSLYNPVLNVSCETFTFNYCRIGARYYFINDVVAINNGVFEISCSCDILATAIDDIQEQEQFILYGIAQKINLYGNYTLFNSNAVRNYKKDISLSKETHLNMNKGTYNNIVNSISKSGNGESLVTTYILTDEEMQRFSVLFNNPNFWQSIKQQWNEPTQAIASSYNLGIGIDNYLPTDNLYDYVEEVPLIIGDYDTGINCLRLKKNAIEKNTNYYFESRILLPEKKESNYDAIEFCKNYKEHWSFGPQCVKYYIDLAFFGLSEIPYKATLDSDYIIFRYRMDLTNGNLLGVLCDKNGSVITNLSGNCGSSVVISNIQQGTGNLSNIIGTVVMGGLALATGGTSGAVMGVGAVASSQKLFDTRTIQNGSYLNNIGRPLVTGGNDVSIIMYKDGYNYDWNLLGDTLCQKMKIKDIYRYCQTEKASLFSSNLTNEENEQLNILFDNGVYINENNTPHE